MTSTANTDDYMFGRNSLASARTYDLPPSKVKKSTELAQYLWRDEFGFLLHPEIPCSEDTRVADIGTGTAIWLLDLARQVHSTVQLDGFDITLAQAPPASWLPANVSLRTLDIFNEVPPNLRGQYDVVNLRLFMCVVQNDDPRSLIRHLAALLKPGGWLQWQEFDLASSVFVSADPQHPPNALKTVALFARDLGKGESEDTRKNPQWVANLAEILISEGLEVRVASRKQTSNSHLAFAHDVNIMTWYEMMPKLPEASAEKLKDLLIEAEHENWDEKSTNTKSRSMAMNMDRWTFVVRKPIG